MLPRQLRLDSRLVCFGTIEMRKRLACRFVFGWPRTIATYTGMYLIRSNRIAIPVRELLWLCEIGFEPQGISRAFYARVVECRWLVTGNTQRRLVQFQYILIPAI